jgi:membrane fusion protein (multidrug efflux system)
MKALFPNPEGVLLPGMFARVKLSGQMIPQALLVPQRAVQQLLGKSFVMVVGEGDKSVARTVTLGAKIGSFYIVKDGLTPQDTVIVEGLTTLREGMDLDVSFVTSKEMGFSMDENDKQYNPDAKK